MPEWSSMRRAIRKLRKSQEQPRTVMPDATRSDEPTKPEQRKRVEGLEDGCLAYIDLTGQGSRDFCPNCYNLNINHQGPALQDDAKSYYMEIPYGERRLRKWLTSFREWTTHGEGERIACPNESCQYCIMLSESIRHLLSSRPDILKGARPDYVIRLESWSDIRVEFRTDNGNLRFEIHPHQPRCERAPQSPIIDGDHQTSADERTFSNDEDLFDGLGEPCRDLPACCGNSTLEFLKSCMEECKGHQNCKTEAGPSKSLPTRLVYLGTSDTEIRLVETADLEDKNQRYIALSHCWGREQPTKLLSTNFKQYKEQIPTANLSQLFRDAIAVARYFEIQYLWVDVFNIIQHDSEDWAQESARMSLVYEKADFVVAATRCVNGTVPFLGPNAIYRNPDFVRFLIDGPDGSPVHADVREDQLGPPLPSGPLSTRAWAFQEVLLPTRTMYFTENGAIWQCQSQQLDEKRLFAEARKAHPRRAVFASYPKYYWHRQLEKYTNCQLTNLTDRLPAISGIATLFKELWHANQGKPEYMAGLWHDDRAFDTQLGWRQIRSYHKDVLPCIDYGDFSVPSWSWASVSQALAWSSPEDYKEYRAQVRLIRWSCIPATSNPYGVVEPGGYLVLEGKPVDLKVMFDGNGYLWASKRDNATVSTCKWFPDCKLTMYEEEVESQDGKRGQRQCFVARARVDDRVVTPADNLIDAKLKLLVLYSSVPTVGALVLARPRNATIKGAFERVGYTTLSKQAAINAGWLTDGVKAQEITII